MVYPRVGGGTLPIDSALLIVAGLSPRGRGNHGLLCASQIRQWSIPAWAGEPVRGGPTPRLDRVYPRVGGGTGLPGAGAPGL